MTTLHSDDQLHDSRQLGVDLHERVRAVAPLLRAHAEEVEDLCHLADECVEALEQAGLFRMVVPLRFGGYELSLGDQFDTVMEIGRACPSTGWVTVIYMEAGFLVGMMSDQAQEDAFGDNPDARITANLKPTGTAKGVDGGAIVSGRWPFCSGARHGDWAALTLMWTPKGQEERPALALVPYSELTLIEDWDTAGLRGTGSITVTCENVFVPEHRFIGHADVMQGNTLSRATPASSSPLWRSHTAAFWFAGCLPFVIGVARGALDAFLERLPGRPITYSTYESQLVAPVTHIEVAGARLRIDGAELHARRAADLVDRAAAAGETLTLEQRAQVRGDTGRAVELCKEAVGILYAASGASAIFRDVAIQRYARDMDALSMHALLHPSTHQELYGRVLLGLEPNSNVV